eukprot:14810338-Ditylum_brightwellii.AAC.1
MASYRLLMVGYILHLNTTKGRSVACGQLMVGYIFRINTAEGRRRKVCSLYPDNFDSSTIS